ncbi:hypothetical protein [uncultured Clostridium sp.]|nr:hypothetical protein [uncultured Clostridium sp.]
MFDLYINFSSILIGIIKYQKERFYNLTCKVLTIKVMKYSRLQINNMI